MKNQKRRAFKDFPPLYLVLLLISCGFTVMWGFPLVYGYGMTIVNLPDMVPLTKLNRVIVLIQFLFSVLTFIGILKFALLKIDYHFYKQHTTNTIKDLTERLRKYEPDEEDYDD